VANSGNKTWKHVKLVHTGGLKPLCHKLDLPVVRPGEKTEILAQYGPLSADHPTVVKR